MSVVPILAAAEFQLPISDPVMIFALAMLIFVGAPLLFERFRIPGIIGLIVAGAAIGPNGLGVLERDETIVLLGTVGLLYLMFIAGVEIDLQGFKRYRARSLAFGAVTFALPQILGTGVGFLLGYGWAAAVLLASMFASHTLVAYPIASRLGIAKNEAVTATVGGTIVTDVAALLVLAIIAASAEGELNAAFWLRLGISLTIFVAVIMVGLPWLARWFFRNEEDGETGAYIFILAALFTAAVLAEVAGVEPIIGAFLAGLALNRLVPEGSPLNNRLHFFGNAVFIPFFLLSVGMLVDVRVLAGSTQAWKVMIGMTVTVIATKWIAAKLAQRRFGYTGDEGWTMFGLSVPQAAATLAAALIGYRIELFDTAVLNGSILMILVTCTIGPWVVETYGRRVALQEEEKPYDPGEAPQRILIPLANPDTADALLDLAFLMRDPTSQEPLLPITVVRGDGRGSQARVAAAEKLLSRAVLYAAGAGVPVVPLTRLDRNYAGGIVRGMAESRTTTVVVGWNGQRSGRSAIFNPVLDRLLECTDQLLLVARNAQPLNTTGRVVLLLPPQSHRNHGFSEAACTIKSIANRLGAPLHGVVIGAEPADYERRLARLRPAVPLSFAAIPSWDELPSHLRSELRAGDLVAAIGARRGSVAWHRELDRLPDLLGGLAPESLLIVYPSEEERTPERDRRKQSLLPRTLTRGRVVLNLPPLPFEEAVDRILPSEFAQDDPRLLEIRESLVRNANEAPTEVVPGVVFQSTPVEGLADPMMFLATSTEGIGLPQVSQPARLLFLLLAPADHPQEHLQHLAAVAHAVSSAERVQNLCQCNSPEALFDWFRAQQG
jgi:Kef-type K+ transport system membrane component KefB/mannitol/fructose-specific phosphotransferase system IIA component (Ntr-type)